MSRKSVKLLLQKISPMSTYDEVGGAYIPTTYTGTIRSGVQWQHGTPPPVFLFYCEIV